MRIRKLLLMIVNAFVFIVAFAALVISILNGLQIVSNLPQNWFPILTVVLLADLVLYNVLEKRTVLEGIQSRLDLVGRGSTVEVVPNRGELYQYAIDAASEGTRLNPIRHIKLYAPLGFRQVDNDKRRWLDALKPSTVFPKKRPI